MFAMSMSMNQDNSEYSYVQPYSTNSGSSDNFLDASNNIDIQGMKRDAQKYTMPSPWFSQKYEQILDTCYEMATNLPAEINNHSTVSGSFGKVKPGEIKMFMKCEM